MLGVLASQTIAPGGAQAPASEQELIDRLRQIQGEVGPGPASPQEPGARAQELIERLEALGREAQSQAPQGPALGEDEVRALLREGLGVEILKIEVIERDGRPTYAVTVMNPPGNYNSAFQVETLLVDGATGGLLGRVPQRPRTAAPSFAEPSGRTDFDGSGLEIRRRTHR